MSSIGEQLGAIYRGYMALENNGGTRRELHDALCDYVRIRHTKREIYDYKVIVDETNNPKSAIDLNIINAVVFWKTVDYQTRVWAGGQSEYVFGLTGKSLI